MRKNAFLFIIVTQIIPFGIYAQTPNYNTIPPNISIKTDTIKRKGSQPNITPKKDSIPTFFYSIGLDGTISSGNVNRQLLNFKTALNFDPRKSVFGFFSNPRFQYGTNSNILQERELFMDINSTLFYTDSDVYFLMFGAFEQSNLRKIVNRYSVGMGIGFKILGGRKRPKARFKLSLTNALVKEVTDFEVNEDKNIFRNSTRLKLSFDIIPNKMSLQSITFLQPSLTDNYYRWNSLSSLTYKIGRRLSFLCSFESTYENFNEVGIQNVQSNATIGLVFSGSKQ
ncbi:MAG: DUF481 domain-containing protein [Arcicella sp.]|nr:DUF481 domain-containing protein [Arcicella sp.]